MLVLKAFWFFALLHKGNSDCSKLGYCANTYCHLTFNKMNCSMWSKQTRGNKSGWFSGRQGSPNRWRRGCYQGRDRLASRPYRQGSERHHLHPWHPIWNWNLLWWHTPKWRMDHDSSALHERVGWSYPSICECCLMHCRSYHLMLHPKKRLHWVIDLIQSAPRIISASGIPQVFGLCWECWTENKKAITMLLFKWLSEYKSPWMR